MSDERPDALARPAPAQVTHVTDPAQPAHAARGAYAAPTTSDFGEAHPCAATRSEHDVARVPSRGVAARRCADCHVLHATGLGHVCVGAEAPAPYERETRAAAVHVAGGDAQDVLALAIAETPSALVAHHSSILDALSAQLDGLDPAPEYAVALRRHTDAIHRALVGLDTLVREMRRIAAHDTTATKESR